MKTTTKLLVLLTASAAALFTASCGSASKPESVTPLIIPGDSK